MRSVEAGRRLAAGFARGLGAYRQRPDRPGLGEAVLSFFTLQLGHGTGFLSVRPETLRVI